MPEVRLAPQPLCASSDLLEGGDAVCFEVMEFGRSAPAFAVRHEQVAVAYLNRCAHVPAEMDWQPGKFWDEDRRFIICSVHGALYEPRSGQCVSGPCRGARLLSIPLIEKEGQVHWCPSDRFQPLF
jgi:nitrite reductase/ring-hydroxylating ferredoxin subunit